MLIDFNCINWVKLKLCNESTLVRLSLKPLSHKKKPSSLVVQPAEPTDGNALLTKHHRYFSEMTPSLPQRFHCLRHLCAADTRTTPARRLAPAPLLAGRAAFPKSRPPIAPEARLAEEQTYIHQHEAWCWVFVLCPPACAHSASRTPRVDEKLALHLVRFKLVGAAP